MRDPVEDKPAARIPVDLILWGLFILSVLAGLGWAMATGRLTWSMAVDVREAAAGFVAGYPLIAYGGFILVFVGMALAVLPIQMWTIIFAGMLFGFWPAVIVCWIGCVLGAVIVFHAANGVLAGRYRRIVDRYLARIETEFQSNQLLWMLALRFVPVVPYCIGNIAPAFLGARFAPFLAAAMIGVIPFILVYAFAGESAVSLLDADTPPDIAKVAADMAPVMFLMAAVPLMALAMRWILRRRPVV